MVTEVPTVPLPGDILPMLGSEEVTVNNAALLLPPPTDTKRSPVVAPGGTVTVIDASVELVGFAYSDGLKTTCGVCVPLAENPLPETVRDEPTAPEY